MSRDPHTPITNGEIYDALIAFRGNLTKTAEHLTISRGVLKIRVEKAPELVVLLEDLREGVLDTAEDNVRTDVEKGDPTASRFVLQTLGKTRGYSAGVAGTGKDGALIVELRSFDEGTKDA